MSKIKLNALLENQTEQEQHQVETIGILKENRIVYQDQQIQMQLEIKENGLLMKRIQEDSVFTAKFIEPLTTEGIYGIKSVDIEFPIRIMTHHLKIESQSIDLLYEMTLASQPPKTFHYQLYYEVIL